jgi:hypothetical protein
MAYLQEQTIWEEGIRRFELDDPVMGGEGGVDNIPLKQLANRTVFLKEKVESLRMIGQYVDLSLQPTPLEMAQFRLLELQYQIIEIALYPELCARKWVGEAQNAAAAWWYKCDADGARNPNGLYMRVEDARGIFRRGAGINSVYTAANNTPYDGGAIGAFTGDAIRNIVGHLWSLISIFGATADTSALYAEAPDVNPSVYNTGVTYPDLYALPRLDVSRNVPTSHENRPASISAAAYMTY